MPGMAIAPDISMPGIVSEASDEPPLLPGVVMSIPGIDEWSIGPIMPEGGDGLLGAGTSEALPARARGFAAAFARVVCDGLGGWAAGFAFGFAGIFIPPMSIPCIACADTGEANISPAPATTIAAARITPPLRAAAR